MKLRDIGEFGLITRIRDRLSTLPASVIKGMGDEAAIRYLSSGSQLVTTVDLPVEEVHSNLSFVSPHPLGRESLAVNRSDIAAMGAQRAVSPEETFMLECHCNLTPRVGEGAMLGIRGC